MTYDLYFRAREGAPAPTRAELAAWLAQQQHVKVDGAEARYEDEHTGFGFSLHLGDAGDSALVSLSVGGVKPHVLGYALEALLSRLAASFPIDVDDPQIGGIGKGAWDSQKFLAGFAGFNRFVHQVTFAHVGQDPPTTLLDRERWDAIWKWNTEVRAPWQDDDAVYFATIKLALVDGAVATLVSLPGPIDCVLPEVDWVVSLDGGGTILTPFGVLRSELERFAGGDAPLRHWQVRSAHDGLGQALASGRRELPQLITPRSVLTRDLVEAALAMRAELQARSRMQEAVSAWNEGRYAECMEHSRGIAGEHAANALGLHGNALGECARYAEATDALTRRLEGDPENAMFRNSLAFYLAREGRTEQARAHYERALARLEEQLQESDEDPALWSRKAYALNGLGRAAEALAASERGLALDPAHTLALVNAGRAMLALGDNERATEVLGRAVKSNADLPQPKFYLAQAYVRLGDMKRSAKALAEAVAKSPNLAAMAAEDPALEPLLAAPKAAKRAPKKPARRKAKPKAKTTPKKAKTTPKKAKPKAKTTSKKAKPKAKTTPKKAKPKAKTTSKRAKPKAKTTPKKAKTTSKRAKPKARPRPGAKRSKR